MLKAIRHGIGNLFNLHGRDARQAFWYYVLFLYLVTTGITLTVTIPASVNAMVTGVQQGLASARTGAPGAAQALGQAAMFDALGGSMRATLWASVAASVILLFGMIAAFVRRLHDSGLSGGWAIAPGLLQLVALALVPAQMDQMDEVMHRAMGGDPLAGLAAFSGAAGFAALASWSAIALVVILGVRKSSEGPNRYGEGPFVA